MRDKDGFLIPCEFSDWRIIDNRDNKDFVCMKFDRGLYSAHFCHADENCKYYKPVKKRGE